MDDDEVARRVAALEQKVEELQAVTEEHEEFIAHVAFVLQSASVAMGSVLHLRRTGTDG